MLSSLLFHYYTIIAIINIIITIKSNAHLEVSHVQQVSSRRLVRPKEVLPVDEVRTQADEVHVRTCPWIINQLSWIINELLWIINELTQAWSMGHEQTIETVTAKKTKMMMTFGNSTKWSKVSSLYHSSLSSPSSWSLDCSTHCGPSAREPVSLRWVPTHDSFWVHPRGGPLMKDDDDDGEGCHVKKNRDKNCAVNNDNDDDDDGFKNK